MALGKACLLLLDIGNTHTHVGVAEGRRVRRCAELPTAAWWDSRVEAKLRAAVGPAAVRAAALCSVVPKATPQARRLLRRLWQVRPFELTAATLQGLALDYPEPETLGPDRLANALAAYHRFGAPVIAVDFGTAVTFDVVDRGGRFIGGVIAPGVAALADYLHEKTARLPRVALRATRAVIGRSTLQAMRIGTVRGFSALVRGVLSDLKRSLRARRLPVVATGGYAGWMARQVPDITAVVPGLTLEGLRLAWQAAQPVT